MEVVPSGMFNASIGGSGRINVGGAPVPSTTQVAQTPVAAFFGWNYGDDVGGYSGDGGEGGQGGGLNGGEGGQDGGEGGQDGGQDGNGEGGLRRVLAKRPANIGAVLATLVSDAVRVTHRPGTGPGKHAYQRRFDDRPFPLNRGCVVTFEAKFDRGFEWGCRGKVGGLAVGPGRSDGGEHSKRGASLRLMWNKGGGAYAYVYVPSGTYDRQPAPLDERVPKGQSVFKEDFSRALVGAGWHTVSIGLKLNTVTRKGEAQADGELLFAIDGKERTLKGVVWRVFDTIKVESFVLGVFHGGGCRARRTSHSNYRNVKISAWAAT